MRKLTFLIFTFIILTGINVGKAQTALPYSINFADSQEGWTAVDESSIPGKTHGLICPNGLISKENIMAALSLRWIILQPVTIIISHQIFF